MSTRASVSVMDVSRSYQPQVGPFPNAVMARVRNVGQHTVYLCSKSPMATSYRVEPRLGWPLHPGEILDVPLVTADAAEALFATTCNDDAPSALRVLTSFEEN